ncbi:hypothetical protein [Pedobacter sp. Leaf176]|uniref:hypothetical protein n=1 Tax=Pedobacter sp. Leaf176 TaxID=1736286 RepID=UPI0006F1F128|nr:hypothetical protein [Pedobacter sp. Leaf176]KQR66972.1 hypothetical protein ASF92_19685 [Pedobacter sp. Leaf176]
MKSGQINFIASVKDSNIDKIDLIARKLSDMGCRVERVMSFSGVITGSTVSNSKLSLDDLKIEGIKNIEMDRDVRAF